jgi:hypothetical protein
MKNSNKALIQSFLFIGLFSMPLTWAIAFKTFLPLLLYIVWMFIPSYLQRFRGYRRLIGELVIEHRKDKLGFRDWRERKVLEKPGAVLAYVNEGFDGLNRHIRINIPLEEGFTLDSFYRLSADLNTNKPTKADSLYVKLEGSGKTVMLSKDGYYRILDLPKKDVQ